LSRKLLLILWNVSDNIVIGLLCVFRVGISYGAKRFCVCGKQVTDASYSVTEVDMVEATMQKAFGCATAYLPKQ
jgi:hypothetical protein